MPPKLRSTLTLALFSLAVPSGWASAQPAASGDRPVADAISVEGGGACIDRDALGEQVHAWIERDRIDEGLRVELDIRSNAGPRAAHLVLRRDANILAERAFPELPSDCPRAVAALGLAIALALDATLLEELSAAALPPATSDFGVSAAIEGSALAGVLGHPAAAMMLGVEVRARENLAARFTIGTTTRHELDVGSGLAQVGLSVGRAELCSGPPSQSAWRLAGCAGVAAGVLRAQGRGFAETSTANLLWLAPTSGLRLSYRLRPPAALTLGVDAMAVLVRPRLQVHDREGDVIAQRSLQTMGAGLNIGLSWAFR